MPQIVRDLARSVDALEKIKKERGRTPEGPTTGALAQAEAKLTSLNGRLATLYGILQEVDAAPTRAALQSAQELRQELDAALAAPAP